MNQDQNNFKKDFFSELERIKELQIKRETLKEDDMAFLYLCSILEEEQ
ncbi:MULTISPECIES: hypothetical protein [Halobacteriovorax]|nr:MULTISPECIES: hypothetical protein [Halobacteriovorax]AYF43140.1 hypothetical protein BALOs_0119 [Halobacteriovorax sp. BALOs_7]